MRYQCNTRKGFFMIDLLSLRNDFMFLKAIPVESIQDSLDKKRFKITKYNKDEIIHFDGEICRYLEVILFGKVTVERIDESGNLLTITQFYPDDILGGNLVFSKNPHYPMTVTAKTETIILEIQKDHLFDLCSNNKELLKVFLELISDHALLLGDKIKHYVNRSIRESIVAFLKYEYKIQASPTIRLNSIKKELADRIGVQRTSLSRELQKMRNECLISYDTASITILNLSILK